MCNEGFFFFPFFGGGGGGGGGAGGAAGIFKAPYTRVKNDSDDG
jgi:hypothetical protein